MSINVNEFKFLNKEAIEKGREISIDIALDLASILHAHIGLDKLSNLNLSNEHKSRLHMSCIAAGFCTFVEGYFAVMPLTENALKQFKDHLITRIDNGISKNEASK